MSNSYLLLEKMFKKEPEVALINHLIPLAVEQHMPLCLEALLGAISKAYQHPRLTQASLYLTQEIVEAALIFPQKVKRFFSKLPFVKVRDIKGQIDRPKAKGSKYCDLSSKFWEKGKDYEECDGYIAAQRVSNIIFCNQYNGFYFFKGMRRCERGALNIYNVQCYHVLWEINGSHCATA